MSQYGGAIKQGFEAQLWQINTPPGLEGHLQLIAIGFGLGALYDMDTIPEGWLQWHNVGHSSEDASARWYYRVLTADVGQETHDFTWAGQVPGVAISLTRADEELTEPGTPGEGPFATTYTPPSTPPGEPATRLDLIARKDPRTLISWADMTILADHFFPGPNTVSASVGSRAINATDDSGKQITIADAYGGGFDTAPFVSSSLLLRATGVTPIQLIGAAIFEDADEVSVQSIAMTNPGPITIGGSTADVVVTVTGSDGEVMEGVTVAAGSIAIATVDAASKVTNASGQVTFTLTGTVAGSRQFVVSAAAVGQSTTIVVEGAATTLVALDDTLTVGSRFTASIRAINDSGIPIANADVQIDVAGVPIVPVTTDLTTDSNGELEYVAEANTAGAFTITATVDGTASLPQTVTVNDIIVDSAGEVRLRGNTYDRPTPLKY